MSIQTLVLLITLTLFGQVTSDTANPCNYQYINGYYIPSCVDDPSIQSTATPQQSSDPVPTKGWQHYNGVLYTSGMTFEDARLLEDALNGWLDRHEFYEAGYDIASADLITIQNYLAYLADLDAQQKAENATPEPESEPETNDPTAEPETEPEPEPIPATAEPEPTKSPTICEQLVTERIIFRDQLMSNLERQNALSSAIWEGKTSDKQIEALTKELDRLKQEEQQIRAELQRIWDSMLANKCSEQDLVG